MKIFINSFILFFSCILWNAPVSAENDFEMTFEIEAEGYQKIADQITRYYLGKDSFAGNKKSQELSTLSINLKKYMQSEPDNPALHFLNGLSLSLLAVNYKDGNNEALFNAATEEKISSYRKAIKLDLSNEPHLSAAVYSTMKHGLPEDLKIEAIQSELKLGGSGDNESYYWFLHWSNIDALQTAGRHKEANQALKNMENELKENNLDASQYKMIVKQVKKSLDIRSDKKNNIAPAKTESIEINRKSTTIWIVSIFSVMALFFMAIYEFFIKKR